MVVITSESVFDLGAHGASARGPKIWAALITANDGQTITTGLDGIDAFITTPCQAPKTNKYVYPSSVPSAGAVTLIASKFCSATAATTATSATTYAIAVGVVR